MKKFLSLLSLLLIISTMLPDLNADPTKQFRIMTLDPGHFHAALVQKEMYPDVSPKIDVYAPLGFDLTEHLNRIARFNTRKDSPTNWELEIHTGPDYFDRMLQEKPGNIVVLSGRNFGKVDRIKASVDAGLNVIADKPWIINPNDFKKLEDVLDKADGDKLIAYDIMTERSEITTIFQKELIHTPDVFGEMKKGSQADPAVYIESVHQILKIAAGSTLIRPAWFFDIKQQGEGVSDVGTHLVDLAQWMIFPEQSLDYKKDVNVYAAKRWPTVMTLADFKKVTNEAQFPSYLNDYVKDGKLDYFCNGSMNYTLRGVHVKLDILWNYDPNVASDTHVAIFKGTKAQLEIRHDKRPELYVVPNNSNDKSSILAALKKKIDSLQSKYAGIGIEDSGEKIKITIPDKLRDGHEPHFAEVMRRYLQYLRDPKSMPAWEKPNMKAKYYTTTQALKLL